MTTDTLLILPSAMASPRSMEQYDTPYGPVSGFTFGGGLPVLLREDGADGRALIYAAKSLGVTRVLAAEEVQAISPLLEQEDLLVLADLIDLTRLRPSTFFAQKGYGFIKLNPPFCPDLMSLCLASARKGSPRAFRGGVYVGTEGPRESTAAECRMFRHWGADVVGTGLIPEAYLARELELCYAALAIVGGGDLLPILSDAARGIGQVRSCACGESMRATKEQGVVGEDWRTWIS